MRKFWISGSGTPGTDLAPRSGAGVERRRRRSELVQRPDDFTRLPPDFEWINEAFPHLLERALYCLQLDREGFDSKVVVQAVRLIKLINDDSPSVGAIDGGVRSICLGNRKFLKALLDQKIENAIVTAWLMNQTEPVLLDPRNHNYGVALPDLMNQPGFKDYPTQGNTPLRDTLIAALMYLLLESIRLRTQLPSLRHNRQPQVLSTSLMCTDGLDQGSLATVKAARFMVEYMRNLGHDMLALGIGSEDIFREALEELGYLPGDIYTVDTIGRVDAAYAAIGRAAASRAIAAAPPRAIRR